MLKLQDKEKQAELGGGEKRIEGQHARGKLTARERVHALLDPGSFLEFGALVTPFGPENPQLPLEKKQYTDGVITGLGTIGGRTVALYAQDFTMHGGSLGKKHGEKICHIIDHASKIGCPIIGIIDSGGARIPEGIHALDSYGKIFLRNIRYSGIIPQISLILGPCAGGAAYSPALTDFIFAVPEISQLFITGPQVIEKVTGETISKDQLGGTDPHGKKSGVIDKISQTELHCFADLKTLLRYIPDNYKSEVPGSDYHEENRDNSISQIIPDDHNKSYDVKTLIAQIFDIESFFELQESFAPNIITGFARLSGNSVGIIANQPLIKAGCIDIDSSCKAARFINFCNSFGIPIISLVDTPGFLPGVTQEHGGIIRHGAKLLAAYGAATVPKITLITRKAFGGAYIVMGSKSMGADVTLCWENSAIAVLGEQAAVEILHRKELAQLSHEQKAQKHVQLEHAYKEKYLTPDIAAESGYIDRVIRAKQTRALLIQALEYSSEKVAALPAKKASNPPL